MSENVTNELMYELLKQIQGDVSHLKTAVHELKQGQIRIRNDIHELKGDVLRLEQSNAGIEIRLDRIEKRLDLVEA
jgi:archaellum component FlaC